VSGRGLPVGFVDCPVSTVSAALVLRCSLALRTTALPWSGTPDCELQFLCFLHSSSV
jgi:hypothetical protein